MELHPLCTLFPRLDGEEFASLVADIKNNGLSEPITVHNGMILDGGNRYRACMEAGVDPQLIEFDGVNIVQFVLSKNLHRRHLSAGQRAAIVASTQDWASAHGHGGGRNFQSATLHLEKSTSESRAAESGTSVRTQKKADKVAKADPALAHRVAHGEISLERAAEQVGEKPRGKNPPARSEADELREQLDDAREMLSALADELAILSDIKNGDEAKRLMQLQAENKALRSQLDDYMTLNGQLKRQVTMLKKQLGS